MVNVPEDTTKIIEEGAAEATLLYAVADIISLICLRYWKGKVWL